MAKSTIILSFESADKWCKWLDKNHSKSQGVWLRIYKKDTGQKSITYGEALDEALCYGWIDGQKDKYDNSSWLQRFTPRRTGSNWSKINTQHAERLIKSGKMKPDGLKEVNTAKTDGRWENAYHSQSTATIPDDFLMELEKDKKAKSFFLSLNKANLYSIAYRLQTAKKNETRAKRMKLILGMLSKGEKFH